MDKQTKFEEDLKAYFPDIYRLNQVGKWDKFFWDVINSMLKMIDDNETGEIVIRYNAGRIDRLTVKRDLLFGRKHEPNLSKPNEF
jgi:hypothetical protein